MKVIILLISVFVFSIAIYGFLRLMDENIKLKNWRKNLVKGINVVIDNGKTIHNAQIVWIGAGWVRVIGPDGKLAAYGIKCVYPTNYIVDEEDHANSCQQGE